jgi:hypothetical protein
MDIDKASIEELLNASKAIRRGEKVEPEKAFKIAKRLANARYLEHARQLAQRLASSKKLPAGMEIELPQKWALWTWIGNTATTPRSIPLESCGLIKEI